VQQRETGQHDTPGRCTSSRKSSQDGCLSTTDYPNSAVGRNEASRQKADIHRVVITLEKFAQGDDGLRVGREATEEIDEILIAYS
jgi:hypothetical protein